MAKAKKPLTEEEQYQVDMNLEAELGRLQRQYKIMDRDRGGYSSGTKLAKTQKVLEIYKNEQKNVMTDLLVATCSTKKKKDDELAAQLAELLSEGNKCNSEIREKKHHLHDIDWQIDLVKKLVTELRGKQVTDIQLQMRISQAQKTLEGLENKLDAATKRFNTLLSENRKLREEINHLLLERMTFNKIWEKLIGNLNKGKTFMMDLIEQATIAYDQREEWVTKLNALRNKSHSDLVMHKQEMQELQRKLDHDWKLEDFLKVKGQKRIMWKLFDREIQKRKTNRIRLEKELQEYSAMLQEILDFTGVNDIQALAQLYVKQEEENFAIFNYINSLYKEIEDLTASLVKLDTKIDSQRALNEQRAEQQTNTLIEMQEKLENMTEQADVTQNDLNGTEGVLGTLYAGIDKLFKICKCSNAPFLELLGDNTSINDYNVLLYLEMLEQRVGELILNVYYQQKLSRRTKKPLDIFKDDEKARALNTLNEIAPTNPCPLCVEQEQVSDVIDSLQFVQTRDEVMVKLEARLSLPDGLERLHNVSACHLPKSRQIIQRRYQ